MSTEFKLGAKVRSLRRKEGLTQTDLASKLEISPSYLNLIEHNQRPLPAHLLVKVAQRTVRFALQVKNVGGKHVELTFPNGQAYDFAVLDASGREVWRWSRGRMFTQGIQNRLLGTGEAMNAGATWPAGKAAGRYTVVATLNSTNFPSEERSDFVLP